MKVNNKDYRLLPTEQLTDKTKELSAFKEKIAHDGHNITNYYSFLDNKINDSYRRDFVAIFNNRCCYCGDSFFEHLNYLNLEIDHILSKSTSFPNVNFLTNLAPACHNCNSGKKACIKTNETALKINPYSSINNVFKRNDELYIVVDSKFQSDLEIVDFYKKAGLGNEIHRLNYILLVLSKMKEKYIDNDFVYSRLSFIYDKIKNSINLSIRVFGGN